MPIRENQLKDFVAVFIIFNISFIVQVKNIYIFIEPLENWISKGSYCIYINVYDARRNQKLQKKLTITTCTLLLCLPTPYYRSVRKLMYLLKYTFMFN